VISPCPKPSKRLRKPTTTCPTCRKEFSAKAMLRHSRCGKPNRFGSVAKKVVVAGEAFPSRLEADTWLLLKRHYPLVVRYPTVHLTEARISWKVDFGMGTAGGGVEFAESKGVETERYRMLKKLWTVYGPGTLRIFKADRRGNPVQVEVIVPTGPHELR
jgi:hypothetical protein